MRKLLASVLTLSVIVGAVAYSTGAFFSDTETSNDNTFTAGGLDLKIDSQQHYNGMVCVPDTENQGQYIWKAEQGNTTPVEQQFPVAGTSCFGTWELTDLVDHKFFNFSDVKPGDMGENTISLHVANNDAWACVDITNVENLENGVVDPEQPDTEDSGELAQNMNFFFWVDNGDNVYEPTGDDEGQPQLFGGQVVSGNGLLSGDLHFALADSTTSNGPILGGDLGDPQFTHYIGAAWCVGDLQVANDGTMTCDGGPVENNVQTDSLLTDISFRIEQARNNPQFRCDAPTPTPTNQ